MIELDPRNSALVLIDLQKGILGYSLTPVTSQELLVRGQALAERFRAAKATVVLVNVAFSPDGADMLRQAVDQPQPLPAGGLPAGWSEFPPGLQQAGRPANYQTTMGRVPRHRVGPAAASTRHPHDRAGRRRDSDWRGIDGTSGV